MRPPWLLAGVTAVALLAAMTIGWFVDHSPGFAQGANAGPPFDLGDEKVISEGAQLFRQTCTGYCHGKDGGPSRAPKLRGSHLDRAFIYGRITRGSPNGMPGFGTVIPQDNIWKLVAYVLSITNVGDK